MPAPAAPQACPVHPECRRSSCGGCSSSLAASHSSSTCVTKVSGELGVGAAPGAARAGAAGMCLHRGLGEVPRRAGGRRQAAAPRSGAMQPAGSGGWPLPHPACMPRNRRRSLCRPPRERDPALQLAPWPAGLGPAAPRRARRRRRPRLPATALTAPRLPHPPAAGVAYVKYDRASSAALAIENLHEVTLNDGLGPRLKVMLAESPQTR